jgi:hypothetical protein
MADKILRFKDILEMDQKRPLADPRPMSFNDMHVTQYRPGEDELINYRAYRRHPKIKRGKEIAKRRIASKEKLMSRTRKQIRLQFFKKFTKDIPKGELTYARRQEIEKRLEKPAIKKRIEQLAKKQFPKVKQVELAKKRGGSK